LLDGFDEIVSGVDRAERAKTFFSLYKLLNSGSPVVLSCRPTYFVANEELNTLIEELSTVESRRTSAKRARGPNVIAKTSQFLEEKYSDEQSVERLLNLTSTCLTLNIFKSTQIDDYLSKFENQFQEKCLCSAK